MRYTIIILMSIFLISCSADKQDSSSVAQEIPTKADVKKTEMKKIPANSQDSSLFGEWLFEKIPDNKGASTEDQEKMRQVFGDTKVELSKKEYNISMMGTLDTGTWSNLDKNTLELKSASGRIQRIGVKQVSNTQTIFTFLGDKDMQMKKSEE